MYMYTVIYRNMRLCSDKDRNIIMIIASVMEKGHMVSGSLNASLPVMTGGSATIHTWLGFTRLMRVSCGKHSRPL